MSVFCFDFPHDYGQSFFSLLYLEHGDCSLEEHLEEFLHLHLPLLMPSHGNQHLYKGTVVLGGTLREIHRICVVGAGIVWITNLQPYFQSSAQPETIR